MKRSLLITLFLALLVACGGSGQTERHQSASSSLSSPALTPIPMMFDPADPSRKISAWKGSPVELLYADALASCNYEQSSSSASVSDAFYAHIFNLITMVQCPAHPDPNHPGQTINYNGMLPELRWLAQRADPYCNIDPSTGAEASIRLEVALPTINATNLPIESPFGGYLVESTAAVARRALHVPVTNLCIAQHLRSKSPGVSSGEALLLSAADQRELLAMTKERAQMAMLQFALLGQVFVTPPATNPGAISSFPGGNWSDFIPMLQQWAQEATAARPSLQTLIIELGEEFATAVQLHVNASQEFAQLLSRSGAARLPRGSSSSEPKWAAAGLQSKAVETWGPGSWRERALASLYGGDPLVEDANSTTPWQHPLHSQSPGETGGASGADWPDIGDAAFVSTELKDPKVIQLYDLAKTADALYLKKKEVDTPRASRYSCFHVESASTIERLYLATEAYLRTNGCGGARDPSTGTCLSPPQPTDVTDPIQNLTSFELWKRFRITPEHAAKLVAWLDELIPTQCQGAFISLNRGPLDFSGKIETRVFDSGSYYHLVNFEPRPRTLRETAGLFTRYSGFWLPRDIDVSAEPVTQGFQGLDVATAYLPGSLDEEARLMGAVPALMAVRESLINSKRVLATNGLPATAKNAVLPFFARAQRIISIIDGAVGRPGIAFLPATERAVKDWGSYQAYYMKQQGRDTPNNRYNITINADPNEDFWDLTATGEYTLFALPGDPIAWGLAANRGSLAFGRSIDDAIVSAPIATPVGASGVVMTCTIFADGTPSCSDGTGAASTEPINSTRWTFSFDLARSLENWTFIARRQNANGTTYVPLVSYVSSRDAFSRPGFNDVGPGRGQYLSFNGSLSNFGANVMAVDLNEPSKPVFDGFGLPNKWLPPADPALFGGTVGDDAVAAYLGRARAAAAEATAAVKDAFDSMLKTEQDQASLAAAVSKSQKVAELERSALCGWNPNCDTAIDNTSIPVPTIWNQAPETRRIWHLNEDGTIGDEFYGRPGFNTLREVCRPGPNQTFVEKLYTLDVRSRLDCVATELLARQLMPPPPRLPGNVPLIPGPFPVLRVVKQHLNDPVVPTFGEYEGGTLQAVAIEQWTAIRAVEDRVRALIAATDAAFAHVNMLQFELENASGAAAEMWNRCSQLEQHVPDLKNCVDVFDDDGWPKETCYVTVRQSFADLIWDDESSNASSTGASNGLYSAGKSAVSMSVGGMRRLCESYRTSVDSATWRLQSAVLEAYANIEAREEEFTQGIARLRAAAAQSLTLQHQADLAIARNDLEVEQLHATQTSTFRLNVQLHSYDGWRAKSLLEAARLSAAVARKVIESRYVVNLSDLSAPEPLVASPSTWADSVYEYDLDMPSAVGLTVGDAAPGGIYPNRMVDYVDNLERFVNGFSISRPTAVASDDTELLSLPGPLGIDPPLESMTSTTSGLTYKNLPDGLSPAWSYFCPNTDGANGSWTTLTPSLNPADVCGPAPARPTKASVLFALDPWGRLHGDIADEPFDKRYNARWTRIGVNVVGTGVLDCTKARDSSACYTQPFLRYRLTHTGAPWITDRDQSWTLLPVPTGQIEGGKALAAEQWLDPIANAWAKPYVSAIARTEFATRPFGGLYELQFDLGPEVVLDRIERVQVLASSNYWVSQR